MSDQVEFSRYKKDTSGITINQCDVRGRDIDEIVDAVLPFVRPKSQDFYSRELRKDLERHGKSLVDVHAGNGTHYTITLDTEPEQLALA